MIGCKNRPIIGSYSTFFIFYTEEDMRTKIVLGLFREVELPKAESPQGAAES